MKLQVCLYVCVKLWIANIFAPGSVIIVCVDKKERKREGKSAKEYKRVKERQNKQTNESDLKRETAIQQKKENANKRSEQNRKKEKGKQCKRH